MQKSIGSKYQALDLLRFPLAVVVVLEHVFSSRGLYVDGYPLFAEVCNFFDAFFKGKPVPIFFFISGFLFFLSGKLTLAGYRKKLKSRIRTLLVPYLLWNALTLAVIMLRVLPYFRSFLSDAGDGSMDLSLANVLSCFWIYEGGLFPGTENTAAGLYPVNVSLWFVRDLMIAVVCAPLIYWLIRRFRHYPVLCIGAVWFALKYLDFPYMRLLSTALFFFSWGAYVSICRKDLPEWGRKYFKAAGFGYCGLSLLYVAAVHYFPLACEAIQCLIVISGLLFALNAASWLMEKGYCRGNSFLSASSFFIYAAHLIILGRVVMKLLARFMQPSSDGSILIYYLCSAVITVLVLLGAFYLLRRFAPSLLKVLTGRA